MHRLDRETSGILLVAKKRSALTHLQDQFRERETGKTYLALVTGQWAPSNKVIDLPCTNTCRPTVSAACASPLQTTRTACAPLLW